LNKKAQPVSCAEAVDLLCQRFKFDELNGMIPSSLTFIR
jgi:hypothetical protein